MRKTIIIVGLVLLAVPVFRAAAATLRELTVKAYDPNRDQLFRVVRGVGEKHVLFLHGLAGSSGYFSHRWPSEISGQTWHAVDLLGFGDSPYPQGLYDKAMHVKAVETYLDSLDLKSPITIVAHSTGALVALGVAAALGDRIDRLILMGAPMYKTPAEAKERIAAIGMMYKGLIDDDLLMNASCFFRDSYRIPWLAPLFDLPVDVYMDATKHSWHSMRGTLQNLVLNFDRDAIAKSVYEKTLFLHGDKDELTPVANVVELEQAGAKVKVIPDSGHQFFLKDPQLLYHELR